MKKFFSLMAVALMSIAMMAGENDLLWDYTDAVPSANPDNGLTYGSKFSDGPGTKNGLRGIKLNDGGYCYFTKAAVAGKLKLGFGPRSGSNAANIDVYTWTGESTTAPARAEMTLIGTTKALTEYGTDEIELTAEQNHIYLCRHNGVETGLQVIQFREAVARTFVDFQIEFRDDPYSVLLPANGELPEGVTVTGVNYNGSQHGIYGGTIT
ncbi:MAG: hypothetical protein II140_06035, partial [Paludibacteraceae bacterium]|nr:hypothetical protein [Paludibacteraceae bacterium]